MIRVFIDDIRNPPDSFSVVLRSYKESIEYFQKNGIPDHISFDHDLGEYGSGYDIVKWMIEQSLDGNLDFPKSFSYNVHSSNPVGKRNIEYLLDNYLHTLA